MKAVIVPVSFPLISELIPFPKGTRLTAAFVTDGHLNLVLEHEDFPESYGQVPMASPKFQRVNDKPEFIEWGVETQK